jgi:hypothetical protein
MVLWREHTMPADLQTVTPALLDGYLGKSIGNICENGLTEATLNHCAHFVNHVMKLDFTYTCKDQNGGTHFAANIRVHETFARCGQVGRWPPPAPMIKCYAFVTRANAVDLATKTMQNIPTKHIGIYCQTHVWHYSNANDQVVKMTPSEFGRVYPGTSFAMFYGSFPE